MRSPGERVSSEVRGSPGKGNKSANETGREGEKGKTKMAQRQQNQERTAFQW